MNEAMPSRFQAIFKEHYPIVIRRIYALIGDRAASEDLAQEAFLRLYRNPPDDLDKVGAWLHRVLTRIVYDYFKKSGRDERLQDKQLQHIRTQQQTNPSNEDAIIKDWEREVVRNVLAKLSDRDRKALLMKEQGYSHAEIAGELQVNPNTVSTLLIRAGQRFKRKMDFEEVAET